VILVVEKDNLLNSSGTYSSFGTIITICGDRASRASPAEPMAFASGSVLESGEETYSAMKPPHTTTHVMFDHMLEPGNAGMGAGSSKASNEKHAVSY
jgi:hypothetical protein